VWLPAACAVALVGTLFWHACLRKPSVHFLAPDRRAEWIVYPAVPSLTIHLDGPRRTVFRRRFTVEQPVDEIRLTVRALTQFTVALNGVEVGASDPSRSWKSPCTKTLRGNLLHQGENELAATVTCQRGPPSLCLALELGSQTVVSDDQWDASLLGAVVQPARLAAAQVKFSRGTPPGDAERPSEALGRVWPTCVAFALLSLIPGGLMLSRWRRIQSMSQAPLCCFAIASSAIAITWLYMLISNWRTLHFLMGYDSNLHLEYIQFVRRYHALPSGNEGMEMWQPPLYYVLAAVLTSLFATPAGSELGIFVLRTFSVLVSLVQLLLVGGCLRLVYPGRVLPQVVGLLFAGCLPMQLYLMHYTSNDVVAAALSTAAVYLALRASSRRDATLRSAVALGACLGAAILAKLTVWPVALVVAVVLVWQPAAERSGIRQWTLRCLLPLAVCALVCGWYFARNWVNFGQPLPPDQAAFRYWQDPGYATPGQFVRFGESLSGPFFSAFAGVPDGIYSTFWGDGGWGGQPIREARPPWNYALMTAGYWLALVPTLLIATGTASILRQVLRGWKPDKLLLLGAGAASFLGIVYFYLQHPIYGAIKAHYALPSVASICVLVAEGYLVVAGSRPWRQLAVSAALGTWGLTALASFMVDRSSPEAQAWVARQLAIQGNLEQALTTVQTAIREHPDDALLRLTAGRLLKRAQRVEEAHQEVAAAVRADPYDAEAQLLLAEILGSVGRHDEKRELLQNVVQLSPDDPAAYTQLVLVNLRLGKFEAAIDGARAGLRVSPTDPLLHRLLAEASARSGKAELALEHQQLATEWQQGRLGGPPADRSTGPKQKQLD
jgi:Flp pilus assembly protein TadD